MSSYTHTGEASSGSLAVRSAEPGDRGAVELLLASIHAHGGWSGLSGLDDFSQAVEGTGAFIVMSDEHLVGAAWISRGDDGPELRLALHPEAAHTDAGARLLGAVAAQARRQGLSTFHATLAFEDRSAFDALTGAGFRVASAFSVGGATRVSLSLA